MNTVATSQTDKACSKCGLPRKIGEYCKPCRRKSDKARNAAAYAANPEKFIALAAKWRDKNPERYRANQAAWRSDNVLPMRGYSRKWRINNREVANALTAAWRIAHPDETRAQKTAFYNAHPDRRVQHEIVRRARKRAAPGSHSEAEWIALKKAYECRCIDCGLSEGATSFNGKPMRLTRGHAVPLAKSGSNAITNIIPQCSRCNCKQGTKVHSSVAPQETVTA